MITVDNINSASCTAYRMFGSSQVNKSREKGLDAKEFIHLALLGLCQDMSNNKITTFSNFSNSKNKLQSRILTAFNNEQLYKQQVVYNLSGILQEGQGIIENLQKIDGGTQLKEYEIKELLKQINKFFINLLTQLSELNKELNEQVTLDEIVTLVKEVAPSTVMVGGNKVLGSGVIIRDNNNKRYILTNAHVVEGIDNSYQDSLEIKIKGNKPANASDTNKHGMYHIKIYNGSDYKKPIEFDATQVTLNNGQKAYSSPDEHDLALLEISPDVKLPEDLGVKMRDLTESPLQAGEPLIAIGNPLGERDSISFGIASHVDRGSDLSVNHFIQTDAAINPGNSGGGLFDMKGRLVGINTWAYMNANSIGGSIRIDYVKAVLENWGIPVMNNKEKEAFLKTTSTIS